MVYAPMIEPQVGKIWFLPYNQLRTAGQTGSITNPNEDPDASSLHHQLYISQREDNCLKSFRKLPTRPTMFGVNTRDITEKARTFTKKSSTSHRIRLYRP
jgi:hypothetical protein